VLDLAMATVLGFLSSQLILLGFVAAHSLARRTVRDLDIVLGIYLCQVMRPYTVIAVYLVVLHPKPPHSRVTAKRRVGVE